VFCTLDYQTWKLTYKWIASQHNNKPKRWWIVEHYFGKRNKLRNDRCVFGDPASDAHLVKFLDRHCPACHGPGRGLTR
jgi:RNA-directed DNA polymerase